MPSTSENLDRLLRAGHPCIRIVTDDEGYALGCVRESATRAGLPCWVWRATAGLTSGTGGEPFAESHVAVKALLGTSRLNPPNMITFLDLSAHLSDPATLRAWRDALETGADLGSTMILIDHSAEAPEIVKRVSTPLRISLPGHSELEAIVREEVRIASTVDKVEARLKRSELDQLVRNLAGLTRSQARLVVREALSDDQRLSVEDLDHVLAGKRRLLHVDGLLEFVEAPATLEGIGGMSNLKRWLKQRQLAGADEVASFGIDPPRGVMMLGVQGAGKSLCAKAIATAWKRPLLRLDPGSLYDKFIGESERRLREALLQAEAMSPIILWIDEIEKGFASASGQSNDGGLSRRMFGELLTWMQEHRAPVFLVATANDIESLPPELMRKGRFDEIFFVDLPGREARKAIFKIHLKKRKRDPGGFDLGAMVDASDGFSGAEIEQAVVTALHSAYPDRAELTTERVVEALRGSPPLSVTMREKVAALRRWAEGRCVPAG